MNALPLLLVLLAQETGGAAPLLEKGERLFRQGDTAGALAAFQEAAKADPRDARPHVPDGRRAGEKGDAPGATAAYRKAIGLKSDFPEAHNNLGALLLAARRRGRCGDASSRRPSGTSPTTPRPSTTWAWRATRSARTARRSPPTAPRFASSRPTPATA